MKDSGIAWVGEIPDNWETSKTRHQFKYKKEVVGNRSEKYDRLALTMQNVVKRSKEDNNGLQPKEFETYQIIRKDELVFKLIDLQNVSTSRVGLSPFNGIVSPAYIIIKQNGKILPRYAEKYFYILWKNQIFNSLGDDGVRSNLGKDDLLNIVIPFPSIAEQKQIADYLDGKCGEIDGLINDIKTQIETLEEYKRSVITEAVTKGQNKSVPLKDSGIPWIGAIPENWRCARIGALYELRNQKVNDTDYLPLSVTMKGILPQLETVAKTNAHDDRKLVRKGDFAINSRSDRRGSCGISDYDGSVSLINTVLKPLNEMNPIYYNWLFHTVEFADEFYKWGHGIVDDLWTTGWQDMKNIVIPQPPINEQKQIADYLDTKCAEIDKIISDKQSQIDTLEEYKKSLIFEYVTGKKEVK